MKLSFAIDNLPTCHPPSGVIPALKTVFTTVNFILLFPGTYKAAYLTKLTHAKSVVITILVSFIEWELIKIIFIRNTLGKNKPIILTEPFPRCSQLPFYTSILVFLKCLKTKPEISPRKGSYKVSLWGTCSRLQPPFCIQVQVTKTGTNKSATNQVKILRTLLSCLGEVYDVAFPLQNLSLGVPRIFSGPGLVF